MNKRIKVSLIIFGLLLVTGCQKGICPTTECEICKECSEEFEKSITYSKNAIGFCYISKCENCEILDNKIPEFNEQIKS